MMLPLKSRSIGSTLVAAQCVVDEAISGIGEDPSKYIVRAQPFGAVESVNGNPVPPNIVKAISEKFKVH